MKAILIAIGVLVSLVSIARADPPWARDHDPGWWQERHREHEWREHREYWRRACRPVWECGPWGCHWERRC